MFHFPGTNPFGGNNQQDIRESHAVVFQEYDKLLSNECAGSALCEKRKNNQIRRTIHPFDSCDAAGRVAKLSPITTLWYLTYVENGDQMTPRQLKKFRWQFGIPYDKFKELFNEL